ncbi:2-oxoacid:acceptor oxidoreductase family protein [Paradesulfitobacterium aromaticivorans]
MRFHGRGGQGTVQAAQLLAKALVKDGKYAQFIPSFGVERKGSPVFGFFRVDEKSIRPKTQVYYPDVIVIMDDTLIDQVDVFGGAKENTSVIINTRKNLSDLGVPETIKHVATVDATRIARETIGVEIPNTVMLGALAKVENLNFATLAEFVAKQFGEKNVQAATVGYDKVEFGARG